VAGKWRARRIIKAAVVGGPTCCCPLLGCVSLSEWVRAGRVRQLGGCSTVGRGDRCAHHATCSLAGACCSVACVAAVRPSRDDVDGTTTLLRSADAQAGLCGTHVTRTLSARPQSTTAPPPPPRTEHGDHRRLSTGAGGDNGIAKMWNRREISVSSDHGRSHYLPPHPDTREGHRRGSQAARTLSQRPCCLSVAARPAPST
jgi:hypothetical protein